MTELLFLLGVALLVGANAFFVAAEFGLVRARESRLEQMREEGLRGAELALRQIDRIDEYLSACQLGITMASLGIGFLGEPAIANLLEEPLGGVVSHGVAVAIAVAFAYLVTTSLHITLGEQVPKIYSIVNAESTVRFTARGLQWFRVGLGPFIELLNSASNGILRLLRVDPRAEFEEASSAEDLKLLIARSAHGGKLDPGEAGMLSGVFHLHEQEARQVMTPIPAVRPYSSTTTAIDARSRWRSASRSSSGLVSGTIKASFTHGSIEASGPSVMSRRASELLCTMPLIRSVLPSSVTTSRVWPESMQRRSATSAVSDTSTVTTAGIGVIT